MSRLALSLPVLRLVLVLARREAASALRGFGVYLAATVAAGAATWFLLIEVRALEVAGIAASADPFRSSVNAAMMILALYFAVGAAVSTARDREIGTLEVLFYAPMNETSYVTGKVLGILCAYLVILPILALCLWLMSRLSGFQLPTSLPASLTFSVAPAAMVASFGVLLAIGLGRVRTAVLVLGGVSLLLIGTAVAYSIVLMIPIENPSSPVLSLRDALAAVNMVLRWISPFSYVQRVVVEGVAIGAWHTAGVGLVLSLVATVTMMLLAAVWLRVRGVQRMAE